MVVPFSLTPSIPNNTSSAIDPKYLYMKATPESNDTTGENILLRHEMMRRRTITAGIATVPQTFHVRPTPRFYFSNSDSHDNLILITIIVIL